MERFLDKCKVLVDSGYPEKFLVNHTYNYLSDGHEMMALSPTGWALHAVGNAINDKESSAWKIAAGIVLRKYPELYTKDTSTNYELANARQAVADILTTGHSKILIPLDAAASGAQLLGIGVGSPLTLETCLGTAKSIIEAFYMPVPNTYRQVEKTAIKQIPFDLRNLYQEQELYDPVKAAVLPTFYGSNNSIKKVFGNDPIMLKAMNQALAMKLPAIAAHHQNFMSIEFTKELVTYTDFLNRKVRLHRTEQVGYEVSTSHGLVLLHGSEPTSIHNSKYPFSFLGLLAQSIHGQDSVFTALNAEYAFLSGFGFFDVHDAFHAPLTRLNDVRRIYRYIMLELLERENLKDIWQQVGGTGEYLYGDKDKCRTIIQNSHLFII